jgi:hypothetical protein
MACECLKILVDNHYLQPNLLAKDSYWIYPITDGKRVIDKPLLVKHCPNCGVKIKD